MNNFVQPSHYDQSHSERRKSVTQQLLKTEKISHWSDDAININDDPGVVSEIEDDELLDDLVTPVDTPSHSSEDIVWICLQFFNTILIHGFIVHVLTTLGTQY